MTWFPQNANMCLSSYV